MKLLSSVLAAGVACAALMSAGCGRGAEQKPASNPSSTPAAEHPAPPADSLIALGSAVAGPFSIEATREKGRIEAGKDAPVYLRIKSSDASVKAAAVRFWIGAEDAKGSVKAKAEIEIPAEPDLWHTHAEIPAPLPANARLWVEVEADKGQKQIASFDLKADPM